MNEDSRYLLSLVEKNVPIYTANPKVKAIAVVGSVARGHSDAHSDIDMTVYYESMPTEAEVVEAREKTGAVFGDWYWNEPNDSGFGEYSFIKGVKVDIGHVTVPFHEAYMAEVLEKHETDMYKQKLMSGMVDAYPVYGHDLINKWKANAAAYPEPLALKMVKEYLRFAPPWILSQMVGERGDVLFLHELLLKGEKNVLGVMLGLNRLYHPVDYKRMDWFIGKMKIAPPDLSNRLKMILQSEAQTAAAEMKKLAEETFALVAEHMPEVDTTDARKLFTLPYMGWSRES